MRTLLFFTLVALLGQPPIAHAGSEPLAQITSVTIAGDSARATITVRQGPIDLATLAISDLEGEAFPLAAASRTLATGATVELVWSKAAPVAGAIVVSAHTLAATDDQLALLRAGEIVDAVAWTNGDGSIAAAEQKDLEALVAATQWSGATQGDAVEVASGMTITRKSPNDTNAKADWSESTAGTGGGGGGGEELPSAGPADLVLLLAMLAVTLVEGLRRLREIWPGLRR